MDDETDCTLFVGDLSKEVTETDLYNLFGHTGEVAEVVVKCSKVTGQPMGYGFVRMSTRDGAEQALVSLAGMNVKGRCIRVGRAERNCRLIVKNLDRSANTDDLIYLFMQYGPLHTKDTGHEVSVNGYSARIIHFISRQDAERAKRDLHLHMFSGRQMHVEWYRHTPGVEMGGDDSSRAEPVVSIHVRFMAVEPEVRVDEHLLYHVFKRFGEVTKISIKAMAPDKDTNLCKGYAFVHFPSSTDGCSTALMAASSTDDQLFSGVHFYSKPSQNFHRAHEMLTRQGANGGRYMPRPNSHNGFGITGLSASSFPRPNSYPADDRVFASNGGVYADMDGYLDSSVQYGYPPNPAGTVRFDQRALAARGGMARAHRTGPAPSVPPPPQPYNGHQYISRPHQAPHNYGGYGQQPHPEPTLNEFGEYAPEGPEYCGDSDYEHGHDSNYALSSAYNRRPSLRLERREVEGAPYPDSYLYSDHDPNYGQRPATAPRYGQYADPSSSGGAGGFLNRRGGDRLAHSNFPDVTPLASPAASHTSATSHGSSTSWTRPMTNSTLNADDTDTTAREGNQDPRRSGRRWDGVSLEADSVLLRALSAISSKSGESEFGGSTSIESTGLDNVEILSSSLF